MERMEHLDELLQEIKLYKTLTHYLQKEILPDELNFTGFVKYNKNNDKTPLNEMTERKKYYWGSKYRF